jgi:hypothetical protein
LDEFYYSASLDVKSKMISDAPEKMDIRHFLPYLAATAHKLANDFILPIPSWVFDAQCYLPDSDPYFFCEFQGNLSLLFLYKSPAEFKHRNLFLDENILMRV